MKKLLIFLLAVVLLVGCAGAPVETPPADDSTSPPETAMQSDTGPSPETTAVSASDDLLCRGRVVIAEDDVITRPDIERPADLSGIEIEVKKGIPIRPGGYGFAYDHSVFTEKDGTFSFEKPSDVFSVSVKYSSLPKGYGATPQIISNASVKDIKECVFTISSISSVDGEFTGIGGGFNWLAMRNSKGEPVMAEFTVTTDPVKAMEIEYEELYSLDEFVITGAVTASQVDFEYIAPLDFSKKDVLGKIGTLYTLGAIDEAKKIEFYCYAWYDNRAKIYCGTMLYVEIQSYRNAHADEELDPALKSAMDRVLNRK